MTVEKVTTWKCKDGRVLEIASMSDDHLNNAILMLDRYGMAFKDQIGRLSRYLSVAVADVSDHAFDAIQSESDAVADELERLGVGLLRTLQLINWIPTYEALTNERTKRKQAGVWTCSAPEHAEFKSPSLCHLYACAAADDLTLGGKGDSV